MVSHTRRPGPPAAPTRPDSRATRPRAIRRAASWLFSFRHWRVKLVFFLLTGLAGWLAWDYWTRGIRPAPEATVATLADLTAADFARVSTAAGAAHSLSAPEAGGLDGPATDYSPELLAVLWDLTSELDRDRWFEGLAGDAPDLSSAADRLDAIADDRAGRYLATARVFYGLLKQGWMRHDNGTKQGGLLPDEQFTQGSTLRTRVSREDVLDAAATVGDGRGGIAGPEFRRFIEQALSGGADLQRSLEAYGAAREFARIYLWSYVLAAGDRLGRVHSSSPLGSPLRRQRLLRAILSAAEVGALLNALPDEGSKPVADVLGIKMRMQTFGWKQYSLSPAEMRVLIERLERWHAPVETMTEWSTGDRRVVITSDTQWIIGRLRTEQVDAEGDHAAAARYLRDVTLLTRFGGRQLADVPLRPVVNSPSGSTEAKAELVRRTFGAIVELPGTGWSVDSKGLELKFERDLIPELKLHGGGVGLPATLDDGRVFEAFLSTYARFADGTVFPWGALPLSLATGELRGDALHLTWPELPGAGKPASVRITFPPHSPAERPSMKPDGRVATGERTQVTTENGTTRIRPLVAATLHSDDLGALRSHLRYQVAKCVSAFPGRAVGEESPDRIILHDTGEFTAPPLKPGLKPVQGRIEQGVVYVIARPSEFDTAPHLQQLEAQKRFLLTQLESYLPASLAAELRGGISPAVATKAGRVLAGKDEAVRNQAFAMLEELVRINRAIEETRTGSDVVLRMDPRAAAGGGPGVKVNLEAPPAALATATKFREAASLAATAALAAGAGEDGPAEMKLNELRAEWEAVYSLLVAQDAGLVERTPRAKAIKHALELAPEGRPPERLWNSRVIRYGGTRYLRIPPDGRNRPGVLVAWRFQDDPLSLGPPQPAIVATETHPDGVFFHPGSTFVEQDLSVTLEVVPVRDGKYAADAVSDRPPGGHVEEPVDLSRRVFREAIERAQVFTCRWADGRWVVRFGRSGAELRPLAVNGDAELAHFASDLFGLFLKQAVGETTLPPVAERYLKSVCTVAFEPILVTDLLERRWEIPVTVRGEVPDRGMQTVALDGAGGVVLLRFDPGWVEDELGSYRARMSVAYEELLRQFPFLDPVRLRSGEAVAPLLAGLPPVTLPLVLAPARGATGGLPAEEFTLELGGSMPPPPLFKAGLGWDIPPGPDPAQVRVVHKATQPDGSGHQISLLVQASYTLPNGRPVNVVCEIPEGTKDPIPLMRKAILEAALPHVRDEANAVARRIWTGASPDVLVELVDGQLLARVDVTLNTPLAALGCELRGRVEFQGKEVRLTKLAGSVSQDGMKKVFAALWSTLSTQSGPIAIKIEERPPHTRLTFEGWKIGDAPLALLVDEQGRVELTPEVIDAALRKLNLATEWSARLEGVVRTAIPNADRLFERLSIPPPELKDGKATVRILWRATNETLGEYGIQVGLAGVKGPDLATELPELLKKLGTKVAIGELPDRFKITVFGLEAEATRDPGAEFYTAAIKLDGDSVRVTGLKLSLNPVKVDYSNARLDDIATKAFEKHISDKVGSLGLPGVGVQLTKLRAVTDPGPGLGIAANVLLTREFFNTLGLADKFPDGVEIPNGLTVFHDGAGLKTTVERGALEEAVSTAVEAQLTKHFPLEIAGRKVSVSTVRYREDRLHLGVTVVEEGDFSFSLTGHVQIPLKGGSLEWKLDLGSSVQESLKAWLKKFIPNTPFFTINQLDVEQLPGGSDFAVRFSFTSELYLMSLKSPLIKIHHGRVAVEAAEPIGFGCNIQVPLGSSPFMLVNPEGTLNLKTKDITIRAKVTVAGYGVEQLVNIEGRLSTNLQSPTYFEIDGSLTVVGLKLASATARLDFAAKNFRCQFGFGKKEVISFDGQCELQLPGGAAPWQFLSDSSVHVLNIELGRVSVRADDSGFRAQAKIDFLVVKANAGFDSDLALKAPRLYIHCSLDLDVGKFGIASAQVGVIASLHQIHIDVFAKAAIAEVAIGFDVPSWAVLTPHLIAAKVVEAIVPKGIEIRGNPLQGLWPPKVPEVRMTGGKIKIGGKRGKGKKSSGPSSPPGQPGAPGPQSPPGQTPANPGQPGQPPANPGQPNQPPTNPGQPANPATPGQPAPPPGTPGQNTVTPGQPGGGPGQTGQPGQQGEKPATPANPTTSGATGAAAEADKLSEEYLRLVEAAKRQIAEAERAGNPARAKELADELAKTLEQKRQKLVAAVAEAYRVEDEPKHGETPQSPPGGAKPTAEPMAHPTAVPPVSGPSTSVGDGQLAQGATAVRRLMLPIDEKTLGTNGENALVVAGAILQQCYAPVMKDGKKVSPEQSIRDFLGSDNGKKFLTLVGTLLEVRKGEGPVTGPLAVIKGPGGRVYEHVLLLLALCEMRDALRGPVGTSVPLKEYPELESLANSLRQETGAPNPELYHLTDAMVRALVVGQGPNGGWAYQPWAKPEERNNGDMSLLQTALFAVRAGLDDGSGVVRADAVRRVFGKNPKSPDKEDVTAWATLGATFAKARKFVDNCKESNGRFSYRPGQRGQANFVGGALLAHAPLPVNDQEPFTSELAALKKELGEDLGLAGGATIFDLAIGTRSELTAMTKVARGEQSTAPFLFHYQCLYTLRGLRMYHRAAQVRGQTTSPEFARQSRSLAEFQVGIFELYQPLAESGFRGDLGNCPGERGMSAIAVLTMSYLARDLGW